MCGSGFSECKKRVLVWDVFCNAPLTNFIFGGHSARQVQVRLPAKTEI
jgi:hypothetical protein